jgi:uncharacterized protein (UPF0332 family)
MDEVGKKLVKLAQDSLRGARILLKENLPGLAASRAYYAMFYTAQALLGTRGFASFSKHKEVIGKFGKELAKTKIFDPIYHRYLIDGFETRQVADYSIMEDIDLNTASETIKHASKFLREAKVYLRKTKT